MLIKCLHITVQMKNMTTRYERFGEVIRYLTMEELKLFFDNIDNYKHKLMFEVMYELGCRVGEFVKIQIRHVNFGRSAIFFPAQNTKTKYARLSYLPTGLTNEIKSTLKQQKRMTKRDETIKNPDAYLFHPGRRWNTPYTENRIRQIFQHYIDKAGLQQMYGADSLGRNLRMFWTGEWLCPLFRSKWDTGVSRPRPSTCRPPQRRSAWLIAPHGNKPMSS